MKETHLSLVKLILKNLEYLLKIMKTKIIAKLTNPNLNYNL